MDSTIPASARIPVIFDTDPGIDDALALALLARHPRFELLAVTTAFGNAPVETTTRNARGLTALYRQDIPVAAGAAGPLLDKRRRKDGIPLLEAKFRRNLARQFPARQQQRILDASLDQATLEAMPVHEYVDLYVI